MFNNRLVIAFGSFDGFHEGHRFFIDEVKKLGSRVIIVLPPDKIIESIKKRPPKFSLKERMDFVKKEYPDIEVVEGDSDLNSWEVLKKYKPDIIAIGYDQMGLKESLQKSGIKSLPEIIVMKSYEPHKFKSSLLS